MSRGSLRLAGCLCLGAAIAIVAWRNYVVATTQWVPLDIQLPLTAAGVLAREFTINRSGTYDVAITIARPPEGQQRTLAECLLGFDDGNPYWGRPNGIQPCNVTPAIDVTWSVSLPKSAGGAVATVRQGVARGLASDGGFSADAVDRYLNAFEATKGTTYVLRLETHMNAEALEPFRPRLVVRPTGLTNEDEAVSTLGIWLLGGVTGVIGIALLGVSLFPSR